MCFNVTIIRQHQKAVDFTPCAARIKNAADAFFCLPIGHIDAFADIARVQRHGINRHIVLRIRRGILGHTPRINRTFLCRDILSHRLGHIQIQFKITRIPRPVVQTTDALA